MNNDAKRNALSFEMLGNLINALDEMLQQKARVVILRANKGAKVWSAGFNIDELPRMAAIRWLTIILYRK